jgi:RNA polymerase primary sigma factor
MGTGNTVGHLGEGEESRMLKRLSSGDLGARRRLIEAYLGMVAVLARRYARRWGVPLEDLVQEGALALVQAVDHYDPDRGMKLSTYATWWVKQAIKRAAMVQSRTVRIPERLWERVEDLSRAERYSGSRTEQKGWVREPSEASSWSDKELEAVRCALRPVVSLEAPVGEEAYELEELLPDPSAEDPSDAVACSDARYRLAEALAALPERERTVLCGRTGFDGHSQSLTTIGKSLGVSRERARQLEGKALKELHERRRELKLEGLVA